MNLIEKRENGFLRPNAEALRSELERQRLTAYGLSRLAGLSYRTVQRILAGERVRPVSFWRVLNALDLDRGEAAGPGAAGSEVGVSRQRFRALAQRWMDETALLSSVTAVAMHPAYQEIIGMGRQALPWILDRLDKEPAHWFWALRSITSEDPVRPDEAGSMDRMRSRWLAWGRERGLVD